MQFYNKYNLFTYKFYDSSNDNQPIITTTNSGNLTKSQS